MHSHACHTCAGCHEGPTTEGGAAGMPIFRGRKGRDAHSSLPRSAPAAGPGQPRWRLRGHRVAGRFQPPGGALQDLPRACTKMSFSKISARAGVHACTCAHVCVRVFDTAYSRLSVERGWPKELLGESRASAPPPPSGPLRPRLDPAPRTWAPWSRSSSLTRYACRDAVHAPQGPCASSP